ncbi:flavodoxin [Variovorax dokdonensis]|uniref:Flavodoxin n=1 Tax=Variovorax dokdonensis TaxID=344883 RepID=A0ABT7NAW4_9BURK|nr:flavodoxin [Variovorax dokdonensis]MDM0045072.1 flavodoxin [Variovorax dokdonensis]
MSNILVVSYSWTGTCTQVGRRLCAQRPGWQHAEIALEKPRSGRAGYWRCVLDSLLRRRPAIVYHGPFPTQFDAVVLVSPIWAFSLASPMRSFVRTRRDHLPDVAVVSVMGGAGASNAEREVERLLGRTCVRAAAFTMQDVQEGKANARIDQFADALQALEDGRQRSAPHISPQAA